MRDVAPTELDGSLGIRCYKHSAPTELSNIVTEFVDLDSRASSSIRSWSDSTGTRAASCEGQAANSRG
jgi:hypothetical protein